MRQKKLTLCPGSCILAAGCYGTCVSINETNPISFETEDGIRSNVPYYLYLASRPIVFTRCGNLVYVAYLSRISGLEETRVYREPEVSRETSLRTQCFEHRDR